MKFTDDEVTVLTSALEERRNSLIRQLSSEHTTLAEGTNLAEQLAVIINALNKVKENSND